MDKALAALVGAAAGLSRARLQALIKAGNVTTADGAVVRDLRHVARDGAVYHVTLPPPEPALPQAQALALAIVYEDADVLVVDKPAGLVVHPAAGNRDHTLVNALLAHCGDSLSGIGGVARPGIVHRLDKDTSGLMVVAKHDAAHQALSRQFADRSLSRVYRALVWGGVTPQAGEVHGAIGRHSRDRKKMAVVPRGGKPALTYYRVVEAVGKGAKVRDRGAPPHLTSPARGEGLGTASPLVTLVECTLATGRTHQIRVHMAHIKHPLVGDQVYGRRRGLGPATGVMGALVGFPRQALHAAALKFIHPRTGKAMRFTAPLPADMAALLKLVGRNGV